MPEQPAQRFESSDSRKWRKEGSLGGKTGPEIAFFIKSLII